MAKLTKAIVEGLEPRDKEYIEWDEGTKGFGIRVLPSGAKAYFVQYRIGNGRAGRVKRCAIAKVDDRAWTLDKARKKATDYRYHGANGVDLRADENKAKTGTVKEMLAAHVAGHVADHNRQNTRKEIERMIRSYIPRWLSQKQAPEVSRDDINRLKRSLKATPYQANRVLAMLSKAFSECQDVPTNPVRGITRYQEDKRERFLSTDEIGRLSDALSNHPNQEAADAIRLLMLTGARKGEVLAATWDQFDEAGNWTKPSALTKTKKEHRIPISAPARELLARRKEQKTKDFVFPGHLTDPDAHLVNIHKIWDAVRQEASLAGVRLHDLRHTYASILASGGQSLVVIGRLLGHTQAQTTLRYSHLNDDPLREATERVGAVATAKRAGNG